MATALEIVKKFYPRVTKVVKAKSPIEVKIDKADVKQSDPKRHSNCAMAVACRRHLHVDGAIISTRTAYLIKGEIATKYDVPVSVAREIVAFDRGASFAVGEYVLQKPRKTLSRGSGTRHAGDPKPGKLTHRKLHKTKGLRSNLLSVHP